MWKLCIESSADDDLVKYFSLYRDYFIDMFSDTGLWNEDEICAGYEALGYDIIRNIRVWIEERLWSDIVLGYKQWEQGRTVIILANKRYVRITYREDDFEKIRSVVHLEIWRKK